MKLGYKIKDINKSISRPRVFFISHDDDHEEYLSRVIAMLHEQSDCMVYFRDVTELHKSIEAEDLGETIADMQLVVIPVTQRLLREPSEAMLVVIPYALDHNIPVLPILMEKDPAERYRKLFGNMQYLDANEDDPTAEPFGKKLASYLSEVLVSPETIQRIKDAFDACIFLSYRKKDRAMARELMHMIHRDPRYRDIAFWYDEFLVPGEDFNDGILNALEDADLFAMVVTPQLLEDPNYVMTHEYPAACDAGKAIFPVEMEDTDESELKRCYKGIPRKVTARENGTWERELGDKLQRLALQTGKDDPQHMFLIGLAYLDGINMEVDTEKAFRLITEAADAGLEEAMRKLSMMYLHGKGVPQSLALSTQWQERLMDSLLGRYETDKSDALLEEIYREQNFLANRYFRFQDDRKALQAASFLRDFAEEKVRRNLTGSRHDLAFCTCKMGTMFHKLDDFFSARKYYEEAAELYTDLMNNEPSDEIRREFSMVYRYLGMLYNSRSNTEEALRNYKRSEDLLLDIRDDGYRKASASYLMSLYIWQAKVIEETERKDIALGLYIKASEIAENIPPEKADFKEKTVLADLYRSMDSLYGRMGRSKEARECSKKEIGILELQIEEARETGMRYADLYIRKGWSHRWRGELEEARRCIQMSLETHEEDPESPAVKESRMNAYEALASLESRCGNNELAREYSIKEIEEAKLLVEQTGSSQYMDRLAERIEKIAGDDPELLEEALAVRHKLYLTYRSSNYKVRKDNLRVRIDDLYKRRLELKRYHIAICSKDRKTSESTSEFLIREGFIVTDMEDYPGCFAHFFIMETEPELILLFFDKDAQDSYKAWKNWENDNLKFIYSKAEVLVVAEHKHILTVRREGKENDHEYNTIQYSDGELVRAIQRQLGINE